MNISPHCLKVLYDAASKATYRDEALSRALKLVEKCAAEPEAYAGHIQQAREQYANDDVEIDDHPLVSPGDGGTWVAAWVWVSDEEVS